MFIVKEETSSLLTSFHSVVMILGWTVMIHIGRSNGGFTGRGSGDMALGSVPWAVGILFGKALD